MVRTYLVNKGVRAHIMQYSLENYPFYFSKRPTGPMFFLLSVSKGKNVIIKDSISVDCTKLELQTCRDTT